MTVQCAWRVEHHHTVEDRLDIDLDMARGREIIAGMQLQLAAPFAAPIAIEVDQEVDRRSSGSDLCMVKS